MKMFYGVRFGVLMILIFIKTLLRYTTVLHYVETSYLTFIVIQMTGCHEMRDLRVGNLETDYKQFYIFLSFFV